MVPVVHADEQVIVVDKPAGLVVHPGAGQPAGTLVHGLLHRFPGGVDGKKVHQKRLPSGAPPWVETVRVYFPRYGRHADELCVTELASVIWAVKTKLLSSFAS